MTDEELAAQSGIAIPVLKAIRVVESGGNPRAVRFETRVFRESTGQTVEGHDRAAFERAYAINPLEAVNSTSWGWWQVMGFNGFPEMFGGHAAAVRAFDANPESVSRQLFLRFMRNHDRLRQAARTRDWFTFVKGYNGCCRGETKPPCTACDRYIARFTAAYEAALREPGGAVAATGGGFLFLVAAAGAAWWYWRRA